MVDEDWKLGSRGCIYIEVRSEKSLCVYLGRRQPENSRPMRLKISVLPDNLNVGGDVLYDLVMNTGTPEHGYLEN